MLVEERRYALVENWNRTTIVIFANETLVGSQLCSGLRFHLQLALQQGSRSVRLGINPTHQYSRKFAARDRAARATLSLVAHCAAACHTP